MYLSIYLSTYLSIHIYIYAYFLFMRPRIVPYCMGAPGWLYGRQNSNMGTDTLRRKLRYLDPDLHLPTNLRVDPVERFGGSELRGLGSLEQSLRHLVA